jgi:hypothetical protein
MEYKWGSKHRSPLDYQRERDGDHLMVPFECDLCIFRKLRKHSPNETLDQDKLLLACIRRINLDCFWSRASSTVISNRDRVKAFLSLSSLVGLEGPFEHIGSMPSADIFGYEVAIVTVLASRRSGKHSSEYTQWDTIRKYCTCYTNHHRASPQANQKALILGDKKGKALRFVEDGCSSYWYSRFLIGCKNRMGQDWRPNKSFSTQLLHLLLDSTKAKIDQASSMTEKSRWVNFGTYAVVAYMVSLRGSEGFLVDLEGLLRNKPDPKQNKKHFFIPLLGKVKGENCDCCHLLPCVFRSSSGIEPYVWIQQLLDLKASQNLVDGPAFSDEKGKILSATYINESMHIILEELLESDCNLFPKSIQSVDDIQSNYQAFRSFRRSSDTRAIDEKVAVGDINLLNRWHIIERAQGKRPNMDMRFHYAQVEELIKPFVRYTRAM